MKNFLRLFLIIACSIGQLIAQPSETFFLKVDEQVHLATEIYKSEIPGSGPVILIRTPYDKSGITVIAEEFTRAGFHVVIQDVRGKYASEGQFVPFVNEKRDGEATLKWLSNQPWNNGNIGLWGSSYLGFCALVLSNTDFTQVKSIFHLSGWIDGTEINSPGGVLHQGLVIPWLMFEGQRSKIDISTMDMDEIFNHTPLVEVFPQQSFLGNNGEMVDLEDLNISHDQFDYEKSNVPIFHLTGWYDFVLPAVLSAYNEFNQHSKGPQFVEIGPWYHNQLYDGIPDIGEYEIPEDQRKDIKYLVEKSIEWFEITLNNNGTLPEKKINYYILFKDKWESTQDWQSFEKSNLVTLYLSQDSLLEKPHNQRQEFSSFIYNPEDPVPTWGGANFNFFMENIGVQEQSQIEERKDVLTFTSNPFEEKKLLVGPISLDLYYTTEGISTDFTAKLNLVQEDGKSYNLTDAIIRVNPQGNGVQKTTLTLPPTAVEIKEGERLRLQISSSNFPKYERNPNTGEDPMEAIKFKSVNQKIFHNEKYPSKIIWNAIQIH